MLKQTSYGPVTRYDLARTLAGKGRYWTTCYRVDGMMVDTGCAFTAPELVQALEGVPLERIVNTHTHEDHIGANGRLQRERNLPIHTHPLALPVLSDPAGCQPLHPYRRLFWGWPEPCCGQPLNETDRVETEHYSFQVFYTPGHAPDHLCLYEAEKGWLFSGDLYVGGQDKALRLGYDIWQIIDSLKRMAALPIAVIYPGSARVREDPAQALESKIAYLEEMGERVLELNRQGRSIDSIARELFGGVTWIELVTLGNFSRRRLVRSYLRINQEGV